jgi:hypothetical protein
MLSITVPHPESDIFRQTTRVFFLVRGHDAATDDGLFDCCEVSFSNETGA